MGGKIFRYFRIILFLFIIGQSGLVQANNIIESQSSALTSKEGPKLILNQESLKIKLYPNYAKIESSYTLLNPNEAQKVKLGFFWKDEESRLGQNVISNIEFSENHHKLATNPPEEDSNDPAYLWSNQEINFSKNQQKIITLEYQQLTSLRSKGLRTFVFKERFASLWQGNIPDLSIDLELKDDLTVSNFKKGSNPDLDLKIEPYGYENSGQNLTWQFKNIEPAFDLNLNFSQENNNLQNQTIPAQVKGASSEPKKPQNKIIKLFSSIWLKITNLF